VKYSILLSFLERRWREFSNAD